MTDDFSRYALIIFCLFAGIEFLVVRLRGHEYRLNSTLSNLCIAMLALVMGYFFILIDVGIYVWIYNHWRLVQLPGPWLWIFAFVAYDFCYYWLHRCNHRINFFWATHIVHHSGEDLNLTTTLRVGPAGFLFNWLFYFPLAIFGVPLPVYLAMGSLNLIYSFWVHTTEVGSLGWFDRFFGSPSNHRVHHGQNEYCIDRNYGGVFMIWDHIFRSFSDEKPREPIVFGTRGGLSRWNPVAATTHQFGELWAQSRHAPNWRAAILLWLRSPGSIAGGGKSQALPSPDRFVKYDVRPDAGIQAYLVGQFAVTLAITAYIFTCLPTWPVAMTLAAALLIVAKMWIVGAFLECDPRAVRGEMMWWLAALVPAGYLGPWHGATLIAGGAASIFILLSLSPPRTRTAGGKRIDPNPS